MNGSGIVVNGVVSGSGGIAGSGGVELSNPANSFTGVTTTTVRLKGGKAADVAGGALVGTGSTGAVTMPFGFFQPVDLTTGVGGVLSTGNLSLSSGQFFVVINGPVAGVDYPQARVTGTVSLGNSILYLYLSSSLIPSVGQTFTFIDNDGSDPISGTFNGLPEGSTITVSNAYPFRLSYFGGDGNDVTLTSLSGAQPTTTTLASSLSPSFPGQQITFTATVTASGGTPTGNVSFREGANVLGTISLSDEPVPVRGCDSLRS